jgi:hypothetical protein
MAVALSSCSGSALEDVYAWPSYLPDGVTVIGECVIPGEMTGVSSPPEILADPEAFGVAILISPWEEWYGYDSADDFGRSFVPELPDGSVRTITLRDTEGITFDHQPVFTDKPATSVAWRESELRVYVTGLGLEFSEVKAIAEGLRPSSAARFPGCE